jgi:ketosteroid isomerase-like protein
MAKLTLNELQLPGEPMKKYSLLLLLLLASSLVWSQNRDAESKLVAMENAWNAAQRDRDTAALDALVADNFVNTDYDGSFQNKAQFLSDVKDPSVKITSAVNDKVHVFMYGNTAVVVGEYATKGSLKGKPFEHKGRFTDTWVQIGGKWQCVASSSQHIQK